MTDPKGFLKYQRELPPLREVEERIKDYAELYEEMPLDKTQAQASRCMDCGIPFCHSGCPLGNIIPEFNEAVYDEDWRLAFEILSSTNNFPEFTGRICPAPCEQACVLGINQAPVAIEHIEKNIIEEAFKRGYVRPQIPASRSGKQVAVVGSGPAGLAAAAQLNAAGHTVTVFERANRIGGLLRYGIPDFKLAKSVIDRRLAIMAAEGVRFQTNANVGENIDARQLVAEYDATILAGGSTIARGFEGLRGWGAKGIEYAMDYLTQSNKRVAGDDLSAESLIEANGKDVIVIGGGDTGADCVGTSNRLGAKSVTQIEILGKPPGVRDAHNWPNWPMILRTSTSHEEGCQRQWALLTEEFLTDDNNQLRAIKTVAIEWGEDASGRNTFIKLPETEQELPCQLLLIAAGFLHPQHTGMLNVLGLGLDRRGNVAASPEHNYQTSVPKVFAAGDMRRGQSLVVWAISEGRECARAVDTFLRGSNRSVLATKDAGRASLV